MLLTLTGWMKSQYCTLGRNIGKLQEYYYALLCTESDRAYTHCAGRSTITGTFFIITSQYTVSKLQEPQKQRAEALFFHYFTNKSHNKCIQYLKTKGNLKAHFYFIYIAYKFDINQVKSTQSVLNPLATMP